MELKRPSSPATMIYEICLILCAVAFVGVIVEAIVIANDINVFKAGTQISLLIFVALPIIGGAAVALYAARTLEIVRLTQERVTNAALIQVRDLLYSILKEIRNGKAR